MSNGEVCIDTEEEGEKELVIYNILGPEVLDLTLSGNTFSVAGLQSGLYLVKVIQNRVSSTQKLVIK